MLQSNRQFFTCFILYFLTNQKLIVLVAASGSGYYYAAYQNFPIGVSFIELTSMNGGPAGDNSKWRAECRDQEALTGIRDVGYDYIMLFTLKCKNLFRFKPPTNGWYPFYERCQIRNLTENVEREQFMCFDPELNPNSADTFVTGIWEDDPDFKLNDVLNNLPAGSGTAMKCCGTPPGYSIDYSQCHFRYTHDDFWQYYDSIHFVVECPDPYVITGIGIIRSPMAFDRHYDWIQCCRLQYVAPQAPVVRIETAWQVPPRFLSVNDYNNLLSYKRVTVRTTTTTETVTNEDKKTTVTTQTSDTQITEENGMQITVPGSTTTKMPFVQTMMLGNEMIALLQNQSEGRVPVGSGAGSGAGPSAGGARG